MAKLFRSNRSQAVRIPKEFEFPPGVSDIEFVKHGNTLVLVPKVTSWADYFARFPPREVDIELPEDGPPQERDFS